MGRYSYRNHCKGKQAHENEGKAQAAIRSLSRFAHEAGRLEAYKCIYCNKWHVGHKRKTQWEKKYG
jgi:hypothetical protein